jgi:hypothetical protein
LWTYIVAKYFNASDLELSLGYDERDHDPLQQAKINEIYVTAKVLHPDEVRADLGRDPLTDEQKEDMKPAPVPMLGGPEDDNGDDPPAPGKKKPGEADDEGATLASKVLKAQKKSRYAVSRSAAAVRPSS